MGCQETVVSFRLKGSYAWRINLPAGVVEWRGLEKEETECMPIM